MYYSWFLKYRLMHDNTSFLTLNFKIFVTWRYMCTRISWPWIFRFSALKDTCVQSWLITPAFITNNNQCVDSFSLIHDNNTFIIIIINICEFSLCPGIYRVDGLLAKRWTHLSIVLFFRLVVHRLYLILDFWGLYNIVYVLLGLSNGLRKFDHWGS